MSEQMGNMKSQSRRAMPTALRDLIFVGAVTLLALVIVYFLDVSGSIDWLVDRAGVLGLHDVVLTSVVVMLSLVLYSLRRWRESSRAEHALHLHQERLEEMVEERTSELGQINEELEVEIAERKQAEEAVRESERFLGTIFHSIYDPFSIIDRQYRIVRVNEAYAQMRGKTVEDLLGAKCHEILREQNMVCEDCVVEKTFISGDPCAKEKLCELPGEGEAWVEIFTHPIVNAEGKVSHVVEYMRDITGRKKTDEEKMRLIKKLEYISRTDVLTGLLNRRAIIAALGSELDRAHRYGSDLSLLLCDIDNFKDVNDAFGHEAGDRALVAIAGTLCGMARASDLIGRYGGDEFMIVLPETGIAGAIDLANRMLSMAKEREVKPFDGGSFNVSLSIGVAGFNADRDNADAFIRRADKALYSAKRSGRGRVSVGS